MHFINLFLLIGFSLAKTNYDGQQILVCNVPDQNTASKLSHLDIFTHKNGFTTLLVKNEKEKEQANSVASCRVKVSDVNQWVTKYQASQVLTDRSAQGDYFMSDEEFFKDYRSYDQIKSQFRQWAKTYSNYTKYIESIGKSIEGRDIFAIEITSPDAYIKKKNILYTGGQHAREWISPATVSYITLIMLKDVESDKTVQNHLKNFVYRIVPVVNPDGYEYTRSDDRLWRKNRRNNGDGTFGVDTNRNWDYKWGPLGSSDDPDSEIYHGTGPASEPEVQSVSKYIRGFGRAYGAIDWHSYGQDVLRSWGWTMEDSSNEPILKKMGDSVANAISSQGYKFTSQKSAGLYPVGGGADDYFAYKAQAVSLTVELCPGGDDEDGFELPPSKLVSCAKAAYSGSKQFSQFLLENPDIPPIKDISSNKKT